MHQQAEHQYKTRRDRGLEGISMKRILVTSLKTLTCLTTKCSAMIQRSTTSLAYSSHRTILNSKPFQATVVHSTPSNKQLRIWLAPLRLSSRQLMEQLQTTSTVWPIRPVLCEHMLVMGVKTWTSRTSTARLSCEPSETTSSSES